MKISIKRWLDRYVGASFCWFFSLFPDFGRAPSEIPQRMLIILLSEMGSLVLAGPMVKHIKDKYPDSELYFLVFEKNQELPALFGFVNNKNLLTIRDDTVANFLTDCMRVVLQLRRYRFDVVIDCELFTRISALLTFFCAAPKRVGFYSYTQDGLYRGKFHNHPVPYNPYLHISQQFLSLAYAIETQEIPNAKFVAEFELPNPPKIVFSAKDSSKFSIKLKQDFPRLVERRIVLIYPGGGDLPIRAWPINNYCNLTKTLIAEGLSVGIIGLQSDDHLGNTIQQFAASRYCINLTGYTHLLREHLLLLSLADLLITNDGGPAHFASTMAVPSIVFFGPECPQLYAPLGSTTVCMYRPLACSPCLTAYNHRRSPCDGDNQCLKQISTTEVLNKIHQVLRLQSSTTN